ncbi:MAG: restriction endonuclease [Alistipes sp.]|nr:restriction endonuclease [Alistipes sp.]
MIPKFQQFFLPCLKCLSDGKIYTQQLLRDYVVEYFKLSPVDTSALIKSGKKTQLCDRVSWTVSYFLQAGLIDAPRRGTYQISAFGQKFFNEYMNGFDKSDLMQIPSFAAFKMRKNEKSENATNYTQPENNKSDEITPTELIDDAFRQINDTLAKDILSKVLEMSPAFFEKLVVELLVKMGYGGSFEDAASVTQYSRDEGIDGVIKEDKLGLDTIYIQAKRWDKGSVGSKDIQAFVGAIDMKHASKGVFITTSTFTDGAKKCAKQVKSKIVLIDGEQLCKYMIEYNLGVSSRQIYEIKQLDRDYFEE